MRLDLHSLFLAPACCLGLSLLLISAPRAARAQSVAPEQSSYRNIVSISPVELFYKTQLGYERRLGRRSTVGVLAGYHYGTINAQPRWEGWQASGFYRRYFNNRCPVGFYVQAQANLFNFSQTANLVEVKTRKPYSLDYRALSGGGGFGLGYRGMLLRRAFDGRLLYNTMLGLRMQHLPKASYDELVYHPEISFLGETDDANWHLGFGPGSLVNLLLTVDYQF